MKSFFYAGHIVNRGWCKYQVLYRTLAELLFLHWYDIMITWLKLTSPLFISSLYVFELFRLKLFDANHKKWMKLQNFTFFPSISRAYLETKCHPEGLSFLLQAQVTRKGIPDKTACGVSEARAISSKKVPSTSESLIPKSLATQENRQQQWHTLEPTASSVYQMQMTVNSMKEVPTLEIHQRIDARVCQLRLQPRRMLKCAIPDCWWCLCWPAVRSELAIWHLVLWLGQKKTISKLRWESRKQIHQKGIVLAEAD